MTHSCKYITANSNIEKFDLSRLCIISIIIAQHTPAIMSHSGLFATLQADHVQAQEDLEARRLINELSARMTQYDTSSRTYQQKLDAMTRTIESMRTDTTITQQIRTLRQQLDELTRTAQPMSIEMVNDKVKTTRQELLAQIRSVADGIARIDREIQNTQTEAHWRHVFQDVVVRDLVRTRISEELAQHWSPRADEIKSIKDNIMAEVREYGKTVANRSRASIEQAGSDRVDAATTRMDDRAQVLMSKIGEQIGPHVRLVYEDRIKSLETTINNMTYALVAIVCYIIASIIMRK